MRNKMIELIEEAKEGYLKAAFLLNLEQLCDMPTSEEYLADHLLANGATLQQWIPVSEAPKEEGRYLCLDVDTGNYFDAYYDDAEQSFGEWRGIYDEGTLGLIDTEFCDYASVTHWMPLPELPKENE